MRERLYDLRTKLNLSMEEFGKRIGVNRSTISRLEAGSNNFTPQMIKSICREFNVDYNWLTEGVGDPFIEHPATLLDELVMEYNLEDGDRILIEEYLNLSPEQRNFFRACLNKFSGQL